MLAKHLTLTAGLIILLGVTAGCWLPDSSGYDYVYDKGGPEQITEWALEENELERIADAQSALSGIIIGGERDDLATRQEAVWGLVRVHKKLASGWPELTAEGENLEAEIEEVLRQDFNTLASTAHELPAAREALLDIRPSDEAPVVRQRAWETIARHAGLIPR